MAGPRPGPWSKSLCLGETHFYRPFGPVPGPVVRGLNVDRLSPRLHLSGGRLVSPSIESFASRAHNYMTCSLSRVFAGHGLPELSKHRHVNGWYGHEAPFLPPKSEDGCAYLRCADLTELVHKHVQVARWGYRLIAGTLFLVEPICSVPIAHSLPHRESGRD